MWRSTWYFKSILVSEVNLNQDRNIQNCLSENIESKISRHRLINQLTAGNHFGFMRAITEHLVQTGETLSAYQEKNTNSSVSSVNIKIFLKTDISDICREHKSIPSAQKCPQIHQTFKCLKSGGLENTDSSTVKTKTNNKKKTHSFCKAPFGIPTGLMRRLNTIKFQLVEWFKDDFS